MTDPTAALIEAIAQRAADIVAARLAEQLPTPTPASDPTRRLYKTAAAQHLGISRRTLDARMKPGGELAGLARRDESGRVYFVLGELDALTNGGRRSVTGVREYRRG